jgi:hypothetical protein
MGGLQLVLFCIMKCKVALELNSGICDHFGERLEYVTKKGIGQRNQLLDKGLASWHFG